MILNGGFRGLAPLGEGVAEATAGEAEETGAQGETFPSSLKKTKLRKK